MTAALRHYLLIEHVAGAAVVNFLINALIAWLSFRHLDLVPLWGQQSILADLVGTTIVLPTLTCLIVTKIVRSHLRRGRIATLPWGASGGALLRRLPDGNLRRGLVLGAISTALFAPPIAALLLLSGVAGLGLKSFVLFKASYAAVMAAIVQPIIALWAIMDGRGTTATTVAVPAFGIVDKGD